MIVFLLFFSFFLSSIILSLQNNDLSLTNYGKNSLKTSILYGILITFITEGLSVFHALNRFTLILIWGIIFIINLLFLWKNTQNNPYSLIISLKKSLTTQKIIFFIHHNLLIIPIILILGITFTTAIIASPNNWDVMTYHLPRVVHWIQNQSIYPYPTNDLRQVSFPPFSGYIITHLYLLANGDYWVNCLQWLSSLGCLIALSLIQGIIFPKTNNFPQPNLLFSGFLYLTIPMVILQSSTAQNDLLTAFFLITCTYFILDFKLTSKNAKQNNIFWIIFSYSLAILTKPTALILGCPLIIYYFYQLLIFQQYSVVKRLSLIFFSAIGFLSLSFPVFIRNYSLFHSIFGGQQDNKVKVISPIGFFSNLLKHLLINFPFPPIKTIIITLHHHLLGITLDDPRWSKNTLENENLLKFLAPHEDVVASPIHLFLLIIILITLLFYFIQKKNSLPPIIRDLILISGSSLCLFFLLLNFSKFNNRLLLPFWGMTIPIIAYSIKKYFPSIVQWGLILILTLSGLGYALTPIRHPLVALPILSQEQINEQSPSILQLKREDIYFSGARKELKSLYQSSVNQVIKKNCHYVGLQLAGESWEYGLWVLFKQVNYPVKMKHLEVKNVTNTLPPEFSDHLLCATIVTH